MSKENPLSHHEQLRYDYLFKNIHYLNDRERREFDYLQQKMTGSKSEVHHFYQEEKEETWGRDIDLPTYGSRSRSKRREKGTPLPKVKKKKRRIARLHSSQYGCGWYALEFQKTMADISWRSI